MVNNPLDFSGKVVLITSRSR
jgi:NAD(P)-dependent dehydrogenase (short-subunit alcohol dehydrogenase family)